MTIRRRPNDFAGRGPVLLQAGCLATCCCCCCLHWVGAALGGTGAIVAASRADEKDKNGPGSPLRRVVKGGLLWAAWVLALGTAALVIAVWFTWDSNAGWLVGPAAIIFTVVAGGAAGMLVACQARRGGPVARVHPVARRYVLGWMWAGALGTAALVIPAAIWLACTSGSSVSLQEVIEGVLGTLAFVPSLVFVPVGAAAMIGAALARLESPVTSDPQEREKMAAGMGLAWRIAWMSFVWSTFAGGFGYLVMYIITLFID